MRRPGEFVSGMELDSEEALSYLLFTDGAVLVAAVGQDIRVGARVSSQAGLASLVQEVEDDQRCDPHDDAKAASDNAVDVARAEGPAEGALEGEGEDGDRGEEVAGGNGEEDNGRRQVGMGRPDHGQFSFAQVDVAIAAVDLKRVHEHADDCAAQDDDEQAET